MRSGLLLLACLVACGDKEEPLSEPIAVDADTDVDTDADTDTDSDTDTDADTDTDTDSDAHTDTVETRDTGHTGDTGDSATQPSDTDDTDTDDTDTGVDDTDSDTDTDDTDDSDTDTDDTDTDADTDDTDTDLPLTCDQDGVFEIGDGESCDDGNACVLDGCDVCDREDSVVLTRFVLSTGDGFDLNDADGDGDPHTGGDNLLGDALVSAFINPLLEEVFETGVARLAFTFSGVDDPTDDTTFSMGGHIFVDPDCPSSPVYDAGNPPPWLNGPAQVYSDAAQFTSCAPPISFSDLTGPDHGIYPVSGPGQPAAPVLVASGSALSLDAGAMGTLTVQQPRMESTVQHDGSRVTGLTNGLLGGVIPLDVLYRIPGPDAARCPTALHAVLGLLGLPDIDLDGTGLDQVNYSASGVPCILSNVTISGCVDGETGAAIPNTTTPGDCVLDARMTSGYSVAIEFSAEELHIVQQVDGGSYCP